MPGIEEFKLTFSYNNRITNDSLYIDWLPQDPNRLYVSIISNHEDRTKLLIRPTIYSLYNLLFNIAHIQYGDEHNRMSADVYLKDSPIELLCNTLYSKSEDKTEWFYHIINDSLTRVVYFLSKSKVNIEGTSNYNG